MKKKFKATWEPSQDAFRYEFLALGAILMALITTESYGIIDLFWTFSIWLESVAIVPQIAMLERVGVDTRITEYYLAALGSYRALYIVNWLYKYFVDSTFDSVSVFAGILQTVIYGKFFLVYYKKYEKTNKGYYGSKVQFTSINPNLNLLIPLCLFDLLALKSYQTINQKDTFESKQEILVEYKPCFLVFYQVQPNENFQQLQQ